MRNSIVAGVGGLVIGHILWLVGIKLATNTADVSSWVLLLAGVVVVVAAACGTIGWLHYRRKSFVWAAFLLCLPISPVIFTIAVLAATYL